MRAERQNIGLADFLPPQRLKEVAGLLNLPFSGHLVFPVRRYSGRIKNMTTYWNIEWFHLLECSDLFVHSAVRLYVMFHEYTQRQLYLPNENRLGYL